MTANREFLRVDTFRGTTAISTVCLTGHVRGPQHAILHHRLCETTNYRANRKPISRANIESVELMKSDTY